jgi:SAM-dependent methyltransferase
MKLHLLEKRKLRGEMARYAVLATWDTEINLEKKLVFWGDTLDDCYSAKISLERYNNSLDIYSFIDNDSRKWGRTFSNTKIMSPQDIKNNQEDYYVIITADFLSAGYGMRSPGGRINERLLNYGFKSEDIGYLFECSCLDIDDFAEERLFNLFIESMEKAYTPPEGILNEVTLPNFINSWFIAIEGWRYIYKWIVDRFRCGFVDVLEIGPGKGNISYCLKHLLDCSINWIDVIDAVPYMRKDLGIALSIGNIELIECPEYDESFDFIIMTEVLEHLNYNPVSCLKKVVSWLKKDGYLYLTTPNNRGRNGERLYDSWREIPDYKVGDAVKTDWGHHFEYVYEEVLALFKEVGLKVEKYKPTFNGAVMSFELSLDLKD